MLIRLDDESLRYDLTNLCTQFFGAENFATASDREMRVHRTETAYFAEYYGPEGTESATAIIQSNLPDPERQAAKAASYKAICTAIESNSPWGILTGVRPIHFYEKLYNIFAEKTAQVLQDAYLLNPAKAALLQTVFDNQSRARSLLTDNSASLYISIPFCPSRCRYCSFVSEVTQKEKNLIPQYLIRLEKEIEEKLSEAQKQGIQFTTVYFGGGTPTVLTPQQSDRILTVIERYINPASLLEYTVEAGRPDTISKEKLDVLVSHGVSRISVNPQTLNDEVLQTIGRKHTVQQFFDAYFLARSAKLSINVDLIAGLETETEESFERTLELLKPLDPDNLTVHTLYMKRGAELTKEGINAQNLNQDTARNMVNYAFRYTQENGYTPYYLYRQKHTVANLENVGYTKPGKESFYNIYMMDDLQTVIGCGAGATTKLLENGVAMRCVNTKFAYNYLKDGSSVKFSKK